MSHGLGVREAMVVYVDQLNFESSERYEREMMLGFFRRSLVTLKKTRNNHMNLNLQRWKHPMATRRTFPLLAPRTFLPRLS